MVAVVTLLRVLARMSVAETNYQMLEVLSFARLICSHHDAKDQSEKVNEGDVFTNQRLGKNNLTIIKNLYCAVFMTR